MDSKVSPLPGYQEAAKASQSTADLTAFVQDLLQQMQSRFQTMSDSIITKIDEMGNRIDGLEKSIGDLIKEVGVEPITPLPEQGPSDSSAAKVFAYYLVVRKWDFRMVMGSGGMPSSHSALCSALTTSVAFVNGVSHALFPVCLGFALIVMYDAAGVRRHAGRQAEVLNMIVADLFQGHPISERKLKELLGHTPLQVFAGASLGTVVGYFRSRGTRVA